MTALALRDDQTQWDGNQLAVLHQTGIDEDVTEPELMAFLHECQRRKLDPFTRQIYLIGRYDNRKRRKVYRSQTSIDGFRLIARRAADKSGIDYSYEDTIWFDEQGKRYEIWLSPKPPAGAKVVVIRNGSRFDAVARFGAYVQTDRDGNPSGQWRGMADVMVAKCAEALALRKAFPEDLGGIYTEEEMAQADNPQRVTVTAEVIRDERTPQNGDDPWYSTSWLDAAKDQAIAFSDPEVGRRLWREVSAKARSGEVGDEDAKAVQDLITARFEDLKAESSPAPSPDPFDAALARIGDDDWAEAVKGIADEEEARRIIGQVDSSTVLTAARRHHIRAAVAIRWPGVADTQGEAA
jgi:phage recombination protein Bet